MLKSRTKRKAASAKAASKAKAKPAAKRTAARKAAPARGDSLGIELPELDVSTLPGPNNVVRRELPNGIVVLLRENFSSPSVVIHGALRVGALFETRETAGLAGFTASALMRGNQNRTFDDIYESLESVGASLGISGATHTSGFHGKSLAEDLDLLLGTLADSLCRPTFPPDHVEKLRGEKLTRLAILANDTGSVASQNFYELAYRDHPYAIDDDGYPETIRAITRDDLINFHTTHYGPRGMILVIVGGVPADQAYASVERHFADWSNPAQPPLPTLPSLKPIEGTIEKRAPMPGKIQSDLILGVPGLPRSDPDYLPALVGNNVLGRFGMMGRIGDAVREQEGLAYYSYSALHGGLGPGPWEVAAGVNPKNVDRAVELIRNEIKRFVTQKVTPTELKENQANFIGRLPMQMETNEGVAGSLMNVELYGLGLDYYQRFPGLVREITRDQILHVAQKHLSPDRHVLSVAGP